MSQQNATCRDSARLSPQGDASEWRGDEDHRSDGVLPTRRVWTAPWPVAAELDVETKRAWLGLQLAIVEADVEPPCRRDPERWWADGSGARLLERDSAVLACRSCPVLEACRIYALTAGRLEQYGVWGGLTAGERAAMRKAAR